MKRRFFNIIDIARGEPADVGGGGGGGRANADYRLAGYVVLPLLLKANCKQDNLIGQLEWYWDQPG